MVDESYTVPLGLVFRFVHMVGCMNVTRDSDFNRFIQVAAAWNIAGLLAVVRKLFGMIGYVGCEVDYDCSAGVLFKKAADATSTFLPSMASKENYEFLGTEALLTVVASSWLESMDVWSVFSGHRALNGATISHTDMDLGGGKTSAAMGLGDSKHAEEVVGDVDS
ncbi:hypothetical protein C7212DRAFT_345443 [Tuber magnatum]|uniref:Uncharacterized protein n=1 Tax=Tuber magnatum TaxID=42249 RepID=A0A317SNY8_9PEZI|nr:hypothetical protein C7212DRAFT_345443 [Tuber magnatum]